MNETAQAQQLLRWPPAAIGAIHRAVAKDRSPADASELLRQIGLESGELYHDLFRSWLGESGASADLPEALDSEEFWARLHAFLKEFGFGSLDQRQLHPGVLQLSTRDWFESGSVGHGHPGCQISTGLLAELFRRIAGEDLAVLEVACRGAGDDECQFLLGSAAALEQIFEQMRGGSPYPDAVASLPGA